MQNTATHTVDLQEVIRISTENIFLSVNEAFKLGCTNFIKFKNGYFL